DRQPGGMAPHGDYICKVVVLCFNYEYVVAEFTGHEDEFAVRGDRNPMRSSRRRDSRYDRTGSCVDRRNGTRAKEPEMGYIRSLVFVSNSYAIAAAPLRERRYHSVSGAVNNRSLSRGAVAHKHLKALSAAACLFGMLPGMDS